MNRIAIFSKPKPVKKSPCIIFLLYCHIHLEESWISISSLIDVMESNFLGRRLAYVKVFVRMPKVVCRMQSLMLICFPKSNCPKLKKNLLWSCLFIRSWRKKLKLLSNTPKTNFRHLKHAVAEFQIFRAENIEVDICATDGTRPPA